MRIYLDDKRKSPVVSHNNERGLGLKFGKSPNWITVRNYDDFVDIVSSNFDEVEFISFDHDISSYRKDDFGKDIEMTGKDAADFVVNYCMDNNKQLPDWFVHSDNTGGNKNIRQLLLNYMFRVENRVSSMTDAYGYIAGKLINHF